MPMTIEEMKTACVREEPFGAVEPVLASPELQHKVTFYPLGFPVEIVTNSQEVLDAAAESWLGYARLFKTKPIQVHILVNEGRSLKCPPPPVLKIQRNLLVNIADADNFGVYDLAQQFTYLSLTKASLAHRSYLRYFFLEPAVLGHISTRYATAIHGACVEQNGSGILLCGDSGAGKTTLAYACAQAGWTYITDDASYLVHGRKDRMVVGNFKQVRFRPSAKDFFPELEGRDITQRAQVGKPSIELFTSPLKQLKRAPSSKVAHMVFLTRRNVKYQELIPFPKEVAKHFIVQTLFSLPDVRAIQEEEVDKFLRMEVHELRYNDMNWAVERLGRLVRDGW